MNSRVALAILWFSILSPLALAEPSGEVLLTPARASIAANQGAVLAHLDAARGELRRAREYDNPSFLDGAEKELALAHALEPGNLDVEKLAIQILLARQDFSVALGRAQALNRRVPDDVLGYGLVADASIGLGQYEAAEAAVQWMLNLRSGNLAALLRAAKLREVYGDLDGALDLLDQAYRRIPDTDLEERAWLLVQVGRLHVQAGRLKLASSALEQSLAILPDYPHALSALGRLRLAQDQPAEAVRLLTRRQELAPRVPELYALAQAMQAAGRRSEAERTYAMFERRAMALRACAENGNRELVYYLVDRARAPRRAMDIARQELARRQDIATRMAYAWALYANGMKAEAREQARSVLAIGGADVGMRKLAGRMGVSS